MTTSLLNIETSGYLFLFYERDQQLMKWGFSQSSFSSNSKHHF